MKVKLDIIKCDDYMYYDSLAIIYYVFKASYKNVTYLETLVKT